MRHGPQAVIALALAVAASLFAGPAAPGRLAAQTEVAPEDVAAIARDLNCPLCQGYNLQDCPLEVCAQMRELIRERLAAGDSREAIVASFVDDYGPQVLNAPPPTGFFATAYVLPALVLFSGAALVAALVARASGRAPEPAGETEVDPAYHEALERMAREEDAS